MRPYTTSNPLPSARHKRADAAAMQRRLFQPFPYVQPLSVGRYFLQCPGVAIGVAEVNVLNAPLVVNLAYGNTPASEHFASLAYVRYNQMETPKRSRRHFRNFAQTSANNNRTS